MRVILTALLLVFCSIGWTQSNMTLSNLEALNVLKGNYDPLAYNKSDGPAAHDILCQMSGEFSADTLHIYLQELVSYHNRNTFSDTLSNNVGVGAARRWAMSRMRSSDRSDFGMVFSYLEFDITGNTCGDGHLKNVLAIKPGYDTSNHEVVLVEAHMDSRCGDRCDVNCVAHGADDNGSGTVLVMELARVMSKYDFPNTIVFMLTVGEEQGLLGGRAMAQLCVDEDINLKAVFNNDIVGGVICGETASPPTVCSASGSIDSTRVRIFANTAGTQGNRNLARWIKLGYEEKLVSSTNVPMTVQIMNQEDRTGRGGDHIPFRELGFNAIRFTSAHEHGNGAGNNDPNYHDRQHSSDDVIGVDTDTDGAIDSFFVDFNYLKRNAEINAMALNLSAWAPTTPEYTVNNVATGPELEITSNHGPDATYRIGVRQLGSTDTSYYFDHLYRMSDKKFIIPGMVSGNLYFVSVASVENGITSIFSKGTVVSPQVNTNSQQEDNLTESFNCNAIGFADPTFVDYGISIYPNPAQTELFVGAEKVGLYDFWEVRLRNLQGQNVAIFPFQGPAKTKLVTRFIARGTYLVQVIVHGSVVKSKRIVLN